MIEKIKLGKQESGKENSKKGKKELKLKPNHLNFGRNFLFVIIYNKMMVYNRHPVVMVWQTSSYRIQTSDNTVLGNTVSTALLTRLIVALVSRALRRFLLTVKQDSVLRLSLIHI